jgi:heme/copper-type cytochrome/quinol oxidase subunit 2
VHGTAIEVIEIVWTVVPALILAVIAVPSFALLYSLEELVEPNLTLKVTGNQV